MPNYSEHFTFAELACPCCETIIVAPGFIEDLEELRGYVDRPIALTSCCRCPEHNASVGGHENSLHLTENSHHDTNTCGVDIKMPKNAFIMQKLMDGLNRFGWSVRLYKHHIHADKRTKYTEDKLQQSFRSNC